MFRITNYMVDIFSPRAGIDTGIFMALMQRTVFTALLSATFAVQTSTAFASVVMPNTRVIYNGGAAEDSIQCTNEGSSPSVMQVATDTGDTRSTPKTADAPFLVS